jgi:hypothetical protein
MSIRCLGDLMIAAPSSITRMIRDCRWVVAIILVVLISACGGSPTAPPAPVVNFQGQYNGTYSVAGCTETAAYAGFCAGTGFTSGTILPIALSLTQSQSNVTGTITLGSLTGPFTGVVQTTGNMTGTATLSPLPTQGLTVIPNVTAWNTTISGSSLNGTFTWAFTVTGVAGGATINATIVQLVRS